MKIQHISDVHCEFHSDKGLRFVNNLPVEGDVLVLPGDFSTFQHLHSLLSKLCLRFSHVVHVCGNHEYYGSDRRTVSRELRKVSEKFSNFHSLNNTIAEIDGVRFLGTTLWWDAAGTSPADMACIQRSLNDFRMIRGYKRWIARENFESIDFLQKNIEEGDIVVTHHAPSLLSKDAPRYGSQHNFLDRCYYNTLDCMISEKKPELWIHGHTHSFADYVINSTRVVSSPHGYAVSGKGFHATLTGECWLDRYGVEEV